MSFGLAIEEATAPLCKLQQRGSPLFGGHLLLLYLGGYQPGTCASCPTPMHATAAGRGCIPRAIPGQPVHLSLLMHCAGTQVPNTALERSLLRPEPGL